MKLFLSSFSINKPEELFELVGKQPKDIKCKVVTNAMDLKKPERQIELKKLVDNVFREVNISFDWLDLRNKTESEIKRSVENLDLLWFCGGNVFYLRYLLKNSGLDKLLIGDLKNTCVLGGESAGALIMGPTLKYLDSVDDPSLVPEVIYDGLGLIDFVPLPHWGNEKYQEKLVTIKKDLEIDGYKVTEFSDKQTIIVKDNEIELLG